MFLLHTAIMFIYHISISRYGKVFYRVQKSRCYLLRGACFFVILYVCIVRERKWISIFLIYNLSVLYHFLFCLFKHFIENWRQSTQNFLTVKIKKKGTKQHKLKSGLTKIVKNQCLCNHVFYYLFCKLDGANPQRYSCLYCVLIFILVG